MKKDRRVDFRLTDDMWVALNKLAKKRGIERSELMRQITVEQIIKWGGSMKNKRIATMEDVDIAIAKLHTVDEEIEDEEGLTERKMVYTEMINPREE